MPDTHDYPSPEELLPIGEAARALGVSIPTLRRWEAEEKIKSTRTLGGQRRFARSELDRIKAAS